MLSSPSARSSSDFSFFSPSKGSKSVASSTSSVVVTTRVTHRPVHRPSSIGTPSSTSPLPSSSPFSSSASSPLSSPPSSSQKRKSPPPGLSAGSSDLPRQVKRLRTTSAKDAPQKRKKKASSKASSRASSRQHTLAPSPEPIYRSSRSRSTSTFPTIETYPSTSTRRWCTDEDGTPGETHLSSEMVVKKLMKSYKSYFNNPNNKTDKSFDPHPTNYPWVELEYPNSNATERFILLAPKDKDHYNPIMDLERSLYTIVEFYLTKQQQALFGPIPGESLAEVVSPPPSPSPSPPHSNSSNASTSSLSSLASSDSESDLTSISSSSSYFPPNTPLLRIVQRAIHKADGPLFLKAMKDVNSLLRSFKYPDPPIDPFAPAPTNSLMRMAESWTERGMPRQVLMRIIEENYQRTVGPNVPSLKQYEAFSSTVYGELMPSLAHEMIQLTKLHEGSLFLDLGSGVGNVVVQASLQTGCRSYGIELMPHPARVAHDMEEQIKVRCRMWGVRVGDIELEQGNMLTSKRVDELMSEADVVLVDNKVFEESLNEALRPKFLDLKEGAIVISLSPFVNAINARLTKRNVDDISAIFDVEERPYHSGSVSWGNNGGTYYIHRVDREGYAKIKEKFESTHNGHTRSTRSRR